MQVLKTFLDQSIKVWQESTAAARFGIILLLLIGLTMIVGVGFWSAQPNYVALRDELSHSESTQLMAALDQADIAYQIKGAGRMILVDKRDFEQASVLAGSRGIGSDTAVIEAASPWMDPLSQQNVLNRNLERQIAHSIKQFTNIESATVHLSIPERQPFLRQADAPSASVVLGIAKGHRFTESNASTIAQFVANAVPGLRPDQVVISDTSGKLYTSEQDSGQVTWQEEFRTQRERDLTHKAQSLLNNFLGIGNSQVVLTAEFAFPDGTTETVEFDPDKRVATREEVTNSTSTGQGVNGAGQTLNNPTGTAGVASNQSSGRQSDPSRSQGHKSETINSEYMVSKTTRKEVVRTPVRERMTISVVVNSKKVLNKSNEIPATVKASIEALVKQAVNFRDGVDEFGLAFEEFVDAMPVMEPVPSAIPWEQIQTVLRNLSLGVAALVVLYFGRKVFKNLQPVSISTTSALSGEQGAKVSQLGDLVKQNPEVFAKILASWANEGVGEKGSQQMKKAA